MLKPMLGGLDREDALGRWLAQGGRKAMDFAVGGLSVVLGVMDRNLRVRYINWTVPGLTPEGILGTDVLQLTPPEYQSTAREHYRKALDEGASSQFEIIYDDGGEVMKWDVRVGPIVANNEVIGFTTASTNVTEQRRAAADRDRFFSLSLDMLVVVSPQGLLKRINPAFAEALDYAADELVGRSFLDLVHPDDRGSTELSFQDLVTGKTIEDVENRYRRKDGKYRVLSWRGTVDPITGDIYSVARDMTAQRATEQQLRHAQKMEAVGQLAGGVAHDFNNLMQTVLGNTELALDDAKAGRDTTEHLLAIEEAADRASSLTRQLLSFSRSQPLSRSLISVGEMVDSVLKLIRRLLPGNIRVECIRGDELASVHADRTQLEQVLINLCQRARRNGDGRLFDHQDRKRARRFLLLRNPRLGATRAVCGTERLR